MQKITPFLWFNDNAEEAVNFYATVFPDSQVTNLVRYGKAGPGPDGSVLTASFRLQGQDFIALNGGPKFKFNESISFVINCRNQEEVDHYWEKLSEGGETSQCGWLKDRFGLSWQVVPVVLSKLLGSGNAAGAGRVMQAMMQMDKLVVAKLEEAFEG